MIKFRFKNGMTSNISYGIDDADAYADFMNAADDEKKFFVFQNATNRIMINIDEIVTAELTE